MSILYLLNLSIGKVEWKRQIFVANKSFFFWQISYPLCGLRDLCMHALLPFDFDNCQPTSNIQEHMCKESPSFCVLVYYAVKRWNDSSNASLFSATLSDRAGRAIGVLSSESHLQLPHHTDMITSAVRASTASSVTATPSRTSTSSACASNPSCPSLPGSLT